MKEQETSLDANEVESCRRPMRAVSDLVLLSLSGPTLRPLRKQRERRRFPQSRSRRRRGRRGPIVTVGCRPPELLRSSQLFP
jgi:hypothetical protein